VFLRRKERSRRETTKKIKREIIEWIERKKPKK
jgi:hypothetical protein